MQIKALVEAALVASVATVCSFMVPTVMWFDFSPGILLVACLTLRQGAKIGMICGLLWGCLLIILGKACILTASQVILEYPLANMSVAVAAVGRRWLATAPKAALLSGVAAAVLVKYTFHFVAGIIFWGKYVQWGMGPWLYSTVINYGSALINLVVFLPLVALLAPQLAAICQQRKA